MNAQLKMQALISTVLFLFKSSEGLYLFLSENNKFEDIFFNVPQDIIFIDVYENQFIGFNYIKKESVDNHDLYNYDLFIDDKTINIWTNELLNDFKNEFKIIYQ